MARHAASGINVEQGRTLMSALDTASVHEAPENTDKKPEPGTGHLGQTFLVGDEIYIRSFETADAANGMAWRGTVFPQSTDLIEKWIKEDLPKAGEDRTGHYAIARKVDDVVVGSAKLFFDDVSFKLELFVDPLYGESGARWKAEALTLIVPWTVEENHRPGIEIPLAATETAVIAAARELGMRETARFREMLLVDGARVDVVWYQRLNKAWIKTLGDPNDVELERTGTGRPRPVPPKVTLDGDPPKNAILVGKRVYLRPEQKVDAKQYAKWARRETETFFDIGRHLPSSAVIESWLDDHQEKDPPEWIWFSVCLRENDEMIGSVGLINVDYVNLFAETGSFFHRADYRGNGYGSEAKHLLLEYTFDVLGLHMVQSWVYFPNTRSAAALRKQGYREAGRINWLYTHEGRFDNFVVFDLLAEEWRAMPRAEWDAGEKV
jgi:RimJ/RimL family protein N-acetyltransferase